MPLYRGLSLRINHLFVDSLMCLNTLWLYYIKATYYVCIEHTCRATMCCSCRQKELTWNSYYDWLWCSISNMIDKEPDVKTPQWIPLHSHEPASKVECWAGSNPARKQWGGKFRNLKCKREAQNQLGCDRRGGEGYKKIHSMERVLVAVM